METPKCPVNNEDFYAMYENIIYWLVKAAAPSHVLGYAADLYKETRTRFEHTANKCKT
jgi:hypothetical protein